jgi:hypothetical protein
MMRVSSAASWTAISRRQFAAALPSSARSRSRTLSTPWIWRGTRRAGVLTQAALSRVESDGRRVLALVANACSTALGLYDPLRLIGEICSLSGLPDFTCAAAPEANILCFRMRGPDELQIAVRDEMIAEGSYYLSTAQVGGKRYLRMAFMNPHTTLREVEGLIQRLRQAASRGPSAPREPAAPAPGGHTRGCPASLTGRGSGGP